ncbi:putative C2H2 finger domain protein [Aspergillus clavatus NRRL 1]|uniref:C2H2 finger domain protein, putative n=1 Tax=Aspergillus clavatus (strain ATCC 1007 / CBS 513.65 / DSM 816 / NCTC 3887 / NRRL 1 / QM 1276 / 107) TaxID=344612 RepID=A1CIT3_ASPCL|nr:C2H2 finger domain protein, putative [Aspergillus clavatus NRRL 1]EAW10788.1 C2H2 finger domain protein, putative [Aspergillus clavatus NRRL 1]
MHRNNPATDIPLPITYTPTTHRISKAKKGKRVHACEHPGCNKVFTRAEHRRRHELNHKPEALYRCPHQGCKKTFHRADLLTRHMARHELEAQMENTTQWERQTHIPMVSSPLQASKCAQVDPSMTTYLGATHPQDSMSIGALVGSPIHPDLANDCGLMWNPMDMASNPHVPMFNSHHVYESVEDTRFYATPETCPSPASDGAGLSLPGQSRSSLSSTPATMIDSYPSSIVESDLTSSPVSMHSHLHGWDPAEGHLTAMVPITLHESLMQAPIACQYPSPTWTPIHHVTYDEQHHLPTVPFQPIPWRSWTL